MVAISAATMRGEEVTVSGAAYYLIPGCLRSQKPLERSCVGGLLRSSVLLSSGTIFENRQLARRPDFLARVINAPETSGGTLLFTATGSSEFPFLLSGHLRSERVTLLGYNARDRLTEQEPVGVFCPGAIPRGAFKQDAFILGADSPAACDSLKRVLAKSLKA